MKNPISRRRFLTGSMALAGSSLLGLPATVAAAEQGAAYRVADAATVAQKIPFYPPALLGLRGDEDGSQFHAHGVAFGKQTYALSNKIDEYYDLIVVGAGISGLSAAYRYLQARPQARVLILDNHDDFGGHARRNEFTANGKTLITYGGSESLDSPNSFSDIAKGLLRDLGVDYTKFEEYYQQEKLYVKKWSLSYGTFFNQATFGKSTLVSHMPDAENAKEIIAQFPMNTVDKQALLDLYAAPKDYWAGKPSAVREMLAETTSYYDFLKDTVKLGHAPLNFLRNISSEYWGHAINAISVREAWEDGYPGMDKLKLTREEEDEEPYIYHFPDGNASIARLLVRKLIPAVASGNTMEDIVTAKFDYDMLDKLGRAVRIRLNSTAVHIENNAQGTVVAYIKRGETQIHQVQAKHTIFAGHSTIAAHIVKGMSEKQKTAMRSSVKIPMMYAKVLLKNAHAWRKMGVYKLYVPSSPYCLIKLDAATSMGDYHHSEDANDPIVLHAVSIMTDFEGKDSREMYRNGRRKLMPKDYATLKNELFALLREIYASVGENFDAVAGDVIINRWAHGYAYEQSGLFDSDEIMERTTAIMRQPVGKIHMANTDVAWMPYFPNAVEEAYRAVEEILRG